MITCTILLVLLVVTIFDSAVGSVFVFAFAQNNATTVGFDTSDILDGILIIADISWRHYCRPCYRNSILIKKEKENLTA